MTQGKHKSLNVRITDEEKKELEKRAKASKMKLSEYVRNVLLSEENAENTQHESDASVLLVLQSELKEKNEQIANLQELLKNQQILTLDLSRENKEKTLLLEQAKRIEQAHGELDGRMWSPENWAK